MDDVDSPTKMWYFRAVPSTHRGSITIKPLTGTGRSRRLLQPLAPGGVLWALLTTLTIAWPPSAPISAWTSPANQSFRFLSFPRQIVTMQNFLIVISRSIEHVELAMSRVHGDSFLKCPLLSRRQVQHAHWSIRLTSAFHLVVVIVAVVC